jgi:hypothetical protein
MITDIYIVYDNKEQLNKLDKFDFKDKYVHLINLKTSKGIKEGKKIMYAWGAMMAPFAIIYDHEHPIRAFYTETDPDIIETLINYIR